MPNGSMCARISSNGRASLFVIVAPWLVIVTPGLIIVASGLIVVPPRIVAASRRRLLVRADIRFKHRAARPAELRGVLPQARHDPVDVRYLVAAKPEHIGRAGHLLFHRPPILLRNSRVLNGDAAASHYRKAQNNPVRSHLRSFRLTCIPRGKCFASGFKRNEAWEGSRRTTKCESDRLNFEERREAGALSLFHLADFLDRRDQARGVLGDEFGKFRRVHVGHRAARGLKGFGHFRTFHG